MAVTPEDLLQKEQEEINTWARQILATYFNWFTVFLTFNGAALGLNAVYAQTPKEKSVALIFFGAFAGWNIIGMSAAGYVAHAFQEADQRIRAIHTLLRDGAASADTPMPRSPIPNAARSTVFLTIAAMLMLFAIWVFLFIKTAL